MSRTYKATGINLKAMPLGESDRLLTILTQEFGLIQAVAPGARKHQSKLGGRSALFVVNELLIASGRSLDKITQADTLESYPGLSQDLGKLAASQYMAELVLGHALSDQPQAELFCLLNEHLRRLEQIPSSTSEPASVAPILSHLSHGIFHILALAGIAPQVQACCLTENPLQPDFTDPNWRVGFSCAAGGVVSLSALKELEENKQFPRHQQANLAATQQNDTKKDIVAMADVSYQTDIHPQTPPKLNRKLNAVELMLLQQLAQPELPQQGQSGEESFFVRSKNNAWVSIEQVLRQYVQYHFGRTLRSASLMDACLSPQPSSP